MPHFQRAFSAPGCCVLPRIALPVVSEWYQTTALVPTLQDRPRRYVSAHIGGKSYVVRSNGEPLPLPLTCRTPTLARCWWTNRTAMEPSPTAEDTRLIEPLRTSPAANTPGRLISKGYGSRASPAQTSPSRAERSTSPPVRSVQDGLLGRLQSALVRGRRVPRGARETPPTQTPGTRCR